MFAIREILILPKSKKLLPHFIQNLTHGNKQRQTNAALEKNMKRKAEPKIVYYTDELNDEFSTAKITPRKIDKDYPYIPRGAFKKFTHFFWYRVVATPLAFLYLKCKFSHKILGKEKLKSVGGCFVYGNHTQVLADPLIPTFISYPKHAYVIVHPNNVSIPVIGKVTPSMGAIPLPDDFSATKNFIKALEYRIDKNNPIFIYPEAHIWPYYTGIRPFSEQSFYYPIKFETPVFCFTNTYRKGRFGRVKIVTYVDGPFYANASLPMTERKTELRNTVYRTMCQRAENNEVEVIKYIKKHD